MALAASIVDLLIVGDSSVQRHVPGDVSFANKLSADERTREAQVALYCFMLSHFVADTCMPCHCDARKLAAYKAGALHERWEAHLLAMIGDGFREKNLPRHDEPDRLTELAVDVDESLGISFPPTIPKLVSGDVWTELVQVARASFALDSIIAPPGLYPYSGTKQPKFDEVCTDAELLEEASKVVLRDAVLNVAMVWKHIWTRFKA
jgi:hypothetical protein